MIGTKETQMAKHLAKQYNDNPWAQGLARRIES